MSIPTKPRMGEKHRAWQERLCVAAGLNPDEVAHIDLQPDPDRPWRTRLSWSGVTDRLTPPRICQLGPFGYAVHEDDGRHLCEGWVRLPAQDAEVLDREAGQRPEFTA